MVKVSLLLVVLTASLSLQIKAQQRKWPKPFDFAISSEAQLSLLKLKEIHVNNLYNYKEELVTQLKQVQLAIKHSRKLLDSSSLYQNNMLFGFKILRHLRNDWPQYLRFMNRVLGAEAIAHSQTLLTQQPTAEDFTDALGAIYRLQTVYNLDPADMAGGILDGTQHNNKIWGADECLILGLMYQYMRHYDQSEYWLELALYSCEEDSPQKQLEVTVWKYSHLLEYLVDANKGLGNYMEAIHYANELLSQEPNHPYMLRQLSKLEELLRKPVKIIKVKKDHQHQKALCKTRYRKRSDNLHCLYVNWSPFLRLAPLKMEELSDEASLNIFPDFITHKEIEILKNISKPNLQRIEDLSWNCSCKVAELSSSSYDIVRKINQRIMDITGLEMNTNNVLQVVNYGLAGNYNPDDTETSANNHKANALIYLSSAEQGGHTVFHSLNLKVKPIKGAMLFWVNSQKTVLHHQCPLLKGNMWLASKRLN